MGAVTLAELARKKVEDLTPEDIKVLEKINLSRSPRALAIDFRRNAKIPKYVGSWLAHPGRYDIPGVDTATESNIERIRKRVTKRSLENSIAKHVLKLVRRYFGDVKLVKRNGYPIYATEDMNIVISPVPLEYLLNNPQNFIAKKGRLTLISTIRGIAEVMTTPYHRKKAFYYPRRVGDIIEKLMPFYDVGLTVYIHKPDKTGILQVTIRKGHKKIYLMAAPKK